MSIAPTRTLHHAGMSIQVFADAGAASRAAALMIRDVIRDAVSVRDRAVIGLATGATPQKVYAQLVAMHGAKNLSFRNVITYNLDEYYPIQPLDPKSYRSYMHQHLFGLVDLPANQTHV
ncbi:MAG: 6-phosphogluconolactonase, partial [Isosphaeraceae bacterium]